MLSLTDDTQAALRHVLDNHAATSLAVLVGSRCQGVPRPDSDWDIAVLLGYSLDAMAQFELEEFYWERRDAA